MPSTKIGRPRPIALRRSAGSLPAFVPWLLAALPLAVLVGFVAFHGVDVPYWDQWLLVPLMEDFHEGQLEVADLWAQHAAHRIFFPRLVFLSLAGVSGWNIRWELALNVVLACGIFLVATSLIRGAWHEGSPVPRWLIAPAVSLLVFNLNQWENWSWGFQIVMFLSSVAMLGGLGLLIRGADRLRNVVAAAGLGVVASFSFASGLLFWPLGLPLVMVPRRGRLPRLLVWSALTATVVGSYLHGFSLTTGTSGGPLPTSPGELARCAAFAVVCLAVPVVSYDGRLAAVVGLAVCLFLVLALLRLRRSVLLSVLPWLAVAGYGVGTAVLAAVGRWHLGVSLAMSSRYITATNFFWLALLGLIVAWPAEVPAKVRPFLRTAAAALILSLLASSVWGGACLHQQSLDRRAARNALAAGELGPSSPWLLPENRIPPGLVDTLRRYRWSLFR